MKTYILTVKHDNGSTNIKVKGSSLEVVTEMLMKAEACPAWSIVKVKEVKK